MKLLLFPLFFFFFCSVNVCAQDDDVVINTVCYSYMYGQDGKLVKLITEEGGQIYTTNYTYEGNNATQKKTGADGTLLAATEERSDTAGHVLFSRHISYNKALAAGETTDTTWSYYKWNSAGLLVSDSAVDSKYGLLHVHRFIYNDTTLLEESIYYPSMKDTFITRYSFDAAGRRLEARHFNKDGSTTVTTYEYNKDGSLRVTREYADFGQQAVHPYNVIRFEYVRGKLVRRYSGDKKPEDAIDYSDETFVYDKSGRLIRMCEKSLE
jgi:hypothetical protein